ncbi:sal-like protein 4 isoform X1 [Gopherus evgoodei]|uniref:sal-like protein 4 isoform X1 n=1 Tax=Gopherus evgoodei TaxID=1825980 RepID=UPI0011CF0944|nr:sal-like protein 4 isoform X1 [Gopherus evgoodei]
MSDTSSEIVWESREKLGSHQSHWELPSLSCPLQVPWPHGRHHSQLPSDPWREPSPPPALGDLLLPISCISFSCSPLEGARTGNENKEENPQQEGSVGTELHRTSATQRGGGSETPGGAGPQQAEPLKENEARMGEKLYQCTQCHKRFSHSSNLLCHWRSHMGEKLFHCTVCGKVFTQHGNLHGAQLDPRRGAPLLVPPVREDLRPEHFPELALPQPHREAALHVPRVREGLWGELCAHGPSMHPYWGAALLVRGVWARLLPQLQPGTAPAHPYRGAALQLCPVRKALWGELHPDPAPVHPHRGAPIPVL